MAGNTVRMRGATDDGGPHDFIYPDDNVELTQILESYSSTLRHLDAQLALVLGQMTADAILENACHVAAGEHAVLRGQPLTKVDAPYGCSPEMPVDRCELLAGLTGVFEAAIAIIRELTGNLLLDQFDSPVDGFRRRLEAIACPK